MAQAHGIRAAGGALLVTVLATACAKSGAESPPADSGTETPARTDLGVVTEEADAGFLALDAGETAEDAAPIQIDAGAPADTGAALPDATPPAPTSVRISGRLVDLMGVLSGAGMGGGGGGGGGSMGARHGVGEAQVAAFNVDPPAVVVTSSGTMTLGEWQLTVPANGRSLLYAFKPGFHPTYTSLDVASQDVTGKTAYIASAAYMSSLAAGYGVSTQSFPCHGAPAGGLSPMQTCVYGIIIGRVVDDGTAGNGTPRPVAGVRAESFEILGPNGGPWFKMGPYFLDADGAVARNANATIALQRQSQWVGGLFLTYVEIPVRDGPQGLDFQISVRTGTGAAAKSYGPVDVKAFRAYQVSWTEIAETGAPPPTPPTGVDFDTQVYPIFLPFMDGGYGCQGAGCHSGPTPTGNMDLSGGPARAYMALDPARFPLRVNLAMPEASLLLVRPLAEVTGMPDHPIPAFLSTNDRAYRTILAWIREGGRRNMGMTMGGSFMRDVLPLLQNPTGQGGAGCVACHGIATDPPGGFSVLGTPAQVHAELTMERPMDNGATGELRRTNTMSPERSLVLINPLSGSMEPHPVKIFYSNVDPRYQAIYRWIAAGAQNN